MLLSQFDLKKSNDKNYQSIDSLQIHKLVNSPYIESVIIKIKLHVIIYIV